MHLGRHSSLPVLHTGILWWERGPPLGFGHRSHVKQRYMVSFSRLRGPQFLVQSTWPIFTSSLALGRDSAYAPHSVGGGECVSDLDYYEKLHPEIKRSKKEIRSLGVLHQDIRPDNILWNAELGRALIIDFHRSRLDSRRIQKRMRQLKGRPCGTEARERKRLRVVD